MTQPPFSGEIALDKAKTLGIIGIAALFELAQGFGSTPTIGRLPAMKQKE